MNGGLNINVLYNLEMLRIHVIRWECHKHQVDLCEIIYYVILHGVLYCRSTLGMICTSIGTDSVKCSSHIEREHGENLF